MNISLARRNLWLNEMPKNQKPGKFHLITQFLQELTEITVTYDTTVYCRIVRLKSFKLKIIKV